MQKNGVVVWCFKFFADPIGHAPAQHVGLWLYTFIHGTTSPDDGRHRRDSNQTTTLGLDEGGVDHHSGPARQTKHCTRTCCPHIFYLFVIIPPGCCMQIRCCRGSWGTSSTHEWVIWDTVTVVFNFFLYIFLIRYLRFCAHCSLTSTGHMSGGASSVLPVPDTDHPRQRAGYSASRVIDATMWVGLDYLQQSWHLKTHTQNGWCTV
jgi:hypothetical protein